MILVRAADAIDRAVGLVCRMVGLVTGSLLLLVVGANVLARYVVATGGFDWAQEVPERLFPWFIMAGIVLAAQQGGHVAVEWILARLPAVATRILLVGVNLLVALAFGWLAEVAMEVAAITAVERSPVLRLPVSHGYWAIALGCVLVAMTSLTIALRIALFGAEALPRMHAEAPIT